MTDTTDKSKNSDNLKGYQGRKPWKSKGNRDNKDTKDNIENKGQKEGKETPKKDFEKKNFFKKDKNFKSQKGRKNLEDRSNDDEKDFSKEAIKVDPDKLFKVVSVVFELTKKRYFFQVGEDENYLPKEKVVVDTARGREIGVICGKPIDQPAKNLVFPLKRVIKKASKEEVEKYESLKQEAKDAYQKGKLKIIQRELPMKLVGAEFTFDRSKLIFYFTAEGRIDFRELVKDLAAMFKLRIELRQIGVRDEARILGTIGICGKELCCRTFINKFDSVSIKMARDQGLVINPSKISGACGRLLCCIKYEHEQYSKALKGYPAVNQSVETTEGKGKVVSVNPLNEYLYVDVFGKGIQKMTLDNLKFSVGEAKKLQNKLTPEERKLRGLEEND